MAWARQRSTPFRRFGANKSPLWNAQGARGCEGRLQGAVRRTWCSKGCVCRGRTRRERGNGCRHRHCVSLCGQRTARRIRRLRSRL